MNMLPEVFQNGEQINLEEILHAREERSYIQQTLLNKLKSKNDGCLLVMTMAVPGPIKVNQALNQAFNEIQIEVEKVLDSKQTIQKLKREKSTGLEYYILSQISPREMKEKMVEIEETHPLGRLFDLDVLMFDKENNIQGMSRTQLGLPVRQCFICTRPAKDCGRSRRHSVLDLQKEISNHILNYFTD